MPNWLEIVIKFSRDNDADLSDENVRKLADLLRDYYELGAENALNSDWCDED